MYEMPRLTENYSVSHLATRTDRSSRLYGLDNRRLHIPMTRDNIRHDRLIDMRLESRSTSISLEEMEDGRVIVIARDAIVYRARL